MPIVLSKMQKNAVSDIMKWFKSPSQYFVLAGFAGTGKTFLILHAIQELGIDMRDVIFATFTGKASLVLTQKSEGKFTSHTLHHVLYKPIQMPDGTVKFSPRNKSDYNGYKLIVVDECSMVTEEILKDLMALGIKILFVGDHGQLEPIGKKTWLYENLQDADFTLTEIHRQAEGNPIIYLSMLARQGKRIDKGSYDKLAYVVPKRQLHTSAKLKRALVRADQVICGYNKTRRSLNQEIRSMLNIKGDLPIVGDKIICLRNNWSKMIPSCALVNGLIGNVKYVNKHNGNYEFRPHLQIGLQPEFTEQEIFNDIRVIPDMFKGKDVKLQGREYYDYDQFDFGYAITCHKAQGSQWDNVLVVNESFGDEPERWLYTAITRASNKLVLAM